MLDWLFETDNFVPRRICGQWSEELILWTNTADLAIFGAYVAIPLAFAYVLYKKRTVPFPALLVMIAFFTIGCGATHLMEYVVFQWPAYHLACVIKWFTAIASWVTLFLLASMLPRLLAEIERKERGGQALETANAELEELVRLRTQELQETNERLRTQINERRIVGDELAAQARELVELQKMTVETLAILDALMQLAPLGMAFLDMDGRYICINNWLAERNGHSVSAHTGKHYKEILEESICRDIEPIFNHVVLTRVPVLGVERDVMVGGLRSWQASFYPVNTPDGRVLGVGVVIADITDVRAQAKELSSREQELRSRVSELISLDKQKTEFLAMLAHELRNPLAPIMNSVYLLQSTVDQDPEQNLELLNKSVVMIHRQVKHMARLIDDLLDVARLNCGKINLKKEPTDFVAALRHALENNREAISGRSHEIKVQTPEYPILVSGDPNRLEQICNNLINNAVKYTEPGGVITIKIYDKESWAVLTVKDNGIGISPETMPRLFDIFAQASRSLDRSQGGLGIGLALSLDLARLHGGTITVASDGMGLGSEFTVKIPLLHVEEARINVKTVGLKKKPTAAAKPLNILVVDDNPDAADSLGILLRSAGHTAQMIYDGATVLRKIHVYRPDAILLDIGLPGLDGYTVCELLRESGYNGLIVAITGYGTETDRRRAIQSGFNYHLTKPVEPEDLEVIINQYAATKLVL